MHNRPHLIVMGVSGCGKSSFGRLLAEYLNIPFIEGDAFHPQPNIAKMAAGISLDDSDREPWLHTLNHELRHADGRVVLSCSALKQSYRNLLVNGIMPVPQFIHLAGSFELIHGRMQARSNHFMPADLLQSQFDTLENPADAITLSIEYSLEELLQQFLAL